MYIAQSLCNPTEMMELKRLSKLFQLRVTTWMKMAFGSRTRLSQLLCVNSSSLTDFEFPPQAELARTLAAGKRDFLVGFENNRENGMGLFFNFVLSNGNRSTQIDEGMNYYERMLPEDTLNRIRSVTIYYDVKIFGFSFFDKDGTVLWTVGETDSDWASS